MKRSISVVFVVLFSMLACSEVKGPTGPTLRAQIDFARSSALAEPCTVYSLGPSPATVFISCPNQALREVRASEVCLAYTDGTFAGNCTTSQTCVFSDLGPNGPTFTGTCTVP
jgi:hypothetical protein